MADYVPKLARLARLARDRASFMASLLAIYQAQEELGDAELAQFLEIDVEGLPLLALCWRPRMDAGGWDSDIEQIATYTKANAGRLARLVQAATAYEAGAMQTTKHHVDFSYTPDELQALFAVARREDVDTGGRYDARSAAINIWTHGWHHPATREESETMGALYFQWDDHRCVLWEIECDEGFERTDLLRELGRLESKALGHILHGWQEGE